MRWLLNVVKLFLLFSLTSGIEKANVEPCFFYSLTRFYHHVFQFFFATFNPSPVLASPAVLRILVFVNASNTFACSESGIPCP